MPSNKQLLLFGSSIVGEEAYLAHCKDGINKLLGKSKSGHILFIPYAMHDWDRYTSATRSAIETFGYTLKSVHEYDKPLDALEDPGNIAMFVGGGNSFRLLKAMYDHDLLDPIRTIINSGTPYIGTSAGSNLACPTIKTTNDMPIVEVSSFNALGLVEFQINPHFISGRPKGSHVETREQRIKQYHEENGSVVIGLPEPSWISVNGNRALLQGADAVIFRQKAEPLAWAVNTDLSLTP
jgi:dipeptidase E